MGKLLDEIDWALFERSPAVEALRRVRLRYPGYFTGRTALAFWCASTEEAVPIRVATNFIDAEVDGVLYVFMPDDLYFGYVRVGGVDVARPEKALFDEFWAAERLGIWPVDPDDVLWERLDPEEAARVLVRMGRDMLRYIPPGDVRTRERDLFREAVLRALEAVGP